MNTGKGDEIVGEDMKRWDAPSGWICFEKLEDDEDDGEHWTQKKFGITQGQTSLNYGKRRLESPWLQRDDSLS